MENYWGSEQRKVCEKGGGGSDGGRGRKSGALIRKREEEQSEKQEVHGHHDGMGGGGSRPDVQISYTLPFIHRLHSPTFPAVPECNDAHKVCTYTYKRVR